MSTPEHQLEKQLIEKLTSLKYEYRSDICNRFSLEKNFREKFETLNRVHLTEGEFQRILEDIITPDVFAAARTLRERSSFVRDDGTPLIYTLVNIRDWCKNTFEVVNQLRTNTDNSHRRYDVILLINGVPVVQIELKTLGISPRRAMEQIVDYKNDPGNGYTKTLLSFLQLFIVSNRSETWYFANNNSRHFAFNADERFLPVYQFAAYIATLKAGEGLNETAIREGYTRFKTEKEAQELAAIAGKHCIATTVLQGFVDGILNRMIFDGEQLSDLMAPLELGWKARTQVELALMEELLPLLNQTCGGARYFGTECI